MSPVQPGSSTPTPHDHPPAPTETWPSDRVLAADIRFSMDGRGRFLDQHLHRTAVEVAEVRGRVPARTPRRVGRGTDYRDVGRLLQRRAPALVVGRADAGRGLPGWSDSIVTTIRRDPLYGAQPAQPRLRAWRYRRASAPSAFPSGAGPDRKTEAGFISGLRGCVHTGRSGTVTVLGPTRLSRPRPGSPKASESTGIHLNFALGLSKEVGPSHPVKGHLQRSANVRHLPRFVRDLSTTDPVTGFTARMADRAVPVILRRYLTAIHVLFGAIIRRAL